MLTPRAIRTRHDIGVTAVGGLVVDESRQFHVLTDPDGNEFCFVSN